MTYRLLSLSCLVILALFLVACTDTTTTDTGNTSTQPTSLQKITATGSFREFSCHKQIVA